MSEKKLHKKFDKLCAKCRKVNHKIDTLRLKTQFYYNEMAVIRKELDEICSIHI